MSAKLTFEQICLVGAQERVTIKIVRATPKKGKRPEVRRLRRKIERPGMVGTVYAWIGPREWTPRKVLPDGFETWVEFFEGDLVSVWEGGRKVMIDIPSQREGLIGFLATTSSYWKSWWIRPDYLKPKFGT